MESDVCDSINLVFLDGRFESRPLYLVLDNVGREKLSGILGVSPENVAEYCCRAVGKQLAEHGDPFANFEVALWKWTVAGRTTLPPFTDLLFVLSHAAEQMVTDGKFTAGNYYDRLAALVGVQPGRLSQYGRSTEQFWKGFNSWLARNDFAFGRPTARAINSNRYVGIAMSQAIVREADRQRFRLMFEKYGFTRYDEVTESEIEQYISTWIHGSQPTRQLKETWKKAELRPRICEAAISELEDWQVESHVSPGAAIDSVLGLSLALAMRHDFAGRSMALFFGTGHSVDPVSLCLRGSGEIELANTTFASFATLEPRSSIPLGHCLLYGLEVDRNGKAAFKWSGRPAIPLARTDQGYWTEVSRVSLGVEHLVLVRNDARIKDAIESALHEAAAPGCTLATPETLRGLPSGWVLYEKVVVRRALGELNGFESVLSPVGEAAGLRLVGGIKLGRGIFHRKLPPRVELESARPNVCLSAWEGASLGETALRSAESEGSVVGLDLAGCIPESGNVYVEGQTGKSTLGSASLLFRTADQPRPLDRQDRAVVSLAGIQHALVGNAEAGASIRGLCVPDLAEVEFDHGLLEALAELPRWVPGEAPAANDVPRQPKSSGPAVTGELVSGLSVEEVLKLPCAVRGFHRLEYAAIPPGAPKNTPVNVECLDCDITYLHRRKLTKKAGTRRPAQRQSIPRSENPGSDIANRGIDYDLWLDCACFLGAGSAAVFETLAASSSVDSWRAGPVVRDLSWLGHLDVELGPTHRPRNWSVSPPVLSVTGDNSACLSGFRSDVFLKELERHVTGQGGDLRVDRAKNQPAIVQVIGLDEQGLREAVVDLRDPHGRSITVSTNVPKRLLSFLSGRPRLFDKFRSVSLGAGLPLQRFDPERNHWRNVESALPGGAYRVAHAGTSYVYVAQSGRAYSGAHEVVKLAAARAAEVSLHAFDAVTGEFTSRLGCEPTGLLGRALVACRGRLPSRKDGNSVFRGVSQGVAAGVMHYLYEGVLPE